MEKNIFFAILCCSLLTALKSNYLSCTQRAIVIGASSGMGREIAKRLALEGYTVGLVARRLPLLFSLQQEIKGPSFIKQIDVTQESARDHLRELIDEMGGLDLIVLSIAATLDKRISANAHQVDFRPILTWKEEEMSLNVDAKGFIALADVAFEFFKKQGFGHLVGISSTSGLRGSAASPVYSAAKACVSSYMEGIRNYCIQNALPIHVTDVVAGYVAVEHSPLGEDPSAYWEITVEEAGTTIIDGIKKKKKIIYVPSRVRIIAWLLKNLPDYFYNRYFSWL